MHPYKILHGIKVDICGRVSNDEGLQEPSKEKSKASGSYKLFDVNSKRWRKINEGELRFLRLKLELDLTSFKKGKTLSCIWHIK